MNIHQKKIKRQYEKLSRASLVIFCILLSNNFLVFADETENKEPASNQVDSGNLKIEPSSKQVLKLNVMNSVLRLSDGLVKLKDISKEIQQQSEQIIAEVTRKDVVFVKGPNLLPNGVVIQAVPAPTGTMAFGNLEPRPKFLNYFVYNLGTQVQALQNVSGALLLTENQQELVHNYVENMQRSVSQICSHYMILKTIINVPKYDNVKIGRESLAIYDEARNVDVLRSKLQKLIKNK